ncbi:Methyl-accepting chemotaxis protein McpC [compost metagenome]
MGEMNREQHEGDGKSGVKSWIRSINVNPATSVGTRLFIIFFAGTLFFTLSQGLFSYQISKETIQNNARLTNQQTVNQTAEKLELVLKRYEDTLQQSLFSSEIQDMVRQGTLQNTDNRQQIILKRKITDALGNWANSNTGVLGVYLIPESDVMPNMVSGMESDGFLNGVKEQEWYSELINSGGTKWLSVPVDQEGEIPYIFRIAKGLYTTGGRSYVIVADIKTSVLGDQLKEIELGNHAVVGIISEQLTPIAVSNNEKIVKFDTSMLANGNRSESGSVNGRGANGESVLNTYSELGQSGWTLMSVVPVSYLLNGTGAILTTTFFICIIVAVLAIIIGFWMARTIATPLKMMKQLMGQAAHGNLQVRMKNKGRDEIGELSSSFNEMMTQITSLVEQTTVTAREVFDTAGELSRASRVTANSASEIVDATEQIASGAVDLAQEAERSNSLMENIMVEMSQVVGTNQTMGESAIKVSESSNKGILSLQELEDTTLLTEQKTNMLTDKVIKLRETATSVIKLLDVMQNITKQTNILSLNASVEAARAGLAGKGFMVIAVEIRRLAEETRQSIKVVSDIVDSITMDMNDTVSTLSEVNPLYARQKKVVQDTSQIFQSVQEQMDDFNHQLASVTNSIENLNKSQFIMSDAMSQVSAVAEQSSATSQEVASVSEQQKLVADKLVELSIHLENASTQLQEKLARFTI